MRILSTSLVAIPVIWLASAGSAISSDVPHSCGTYSGTTEEIAAEESHFQDLVKQIGNSTLAKRADPFRILVNWNIFYDKNNPSDGNYTDDVVNYQLGYANRALAQNNFNLLLRKNRTIRHGIEYSVLHGVAQSNLTNSVEYVIKTMTASGGDASTLNVYTVGENNDPNITDVGWATFPGQFKDHPWRDGIVLVYDYLPGINDYYPDRNHGGLLVHELGHWLGLRHTFEEGKCDPNGYFTGDYVPDTPAQKLSGGFECRVTQDSCPDIPGTDPVHNYMDYSNDDCYNNFTSGQYQRVRNQIKVFRNITV